MTKKHLLEILKDVPDDSIIMAVDPEEGGLHPITSAVIWPPTGSIRGEVELLTGEE